MHYPRVDTTISTTKQPIPPEDDQREEKRGAKIDWSRRMPVHGQSATNMVNMFKAKWGNFYESLVISRPTTTYTVFKYTS